MIAQDNGAQAYIHQLTAFLHFAIWYRALDNPPLFGLSDRSLENYQSYVDSRKAVYSQRTAAWSMRFAVRIEAAVIVQQVLFPDR